MAKFRIMLDGKPVRYVKPVKHGAPMINFADHQYGPMEIGEVYAKRLCGALRKYGYEPEMVAA